MICPNCRRPLDSRECADLTHREARQASPPPPAAMRECADLRHTGPRLQPIEKFWARGSRVLRKSCSSCRWKRRVQRRARGRGASVRAQWEADQFWNEQAASHN